MKKTILTFFLFTLGQIVFGQVSGNQVFSDNANNYNNYADNNKEITGKNRINKLYLNDSSFVIEAKVLKNVKADNYVAVFGLKQEAVTINDCSSKINERINGFIKNIKKLGVKDVDIYTDLLTQFRVYDFEKLDNSYKEYVKGFELSKNIIVKYSKPDQIEQFLTLAAQDSIFDLVKVDYIINDVSKVYDELFVSAKETIQKKKQMYIDLTNVRLKPTAQIYGENFSSYYPSELYKNYKAFALNYYENYNWFQGKETKHLHKFQTFYFDKIDYSNFDKIINPIILEPTIQVMLVIQVKYEMIR